MTTPAQPHQPHPGPTVGDVFLRRTRLGLLAAPTVCPSDGDAARRVARVLGAELGWDQARV